MSTVRDHLTSLLSLNSIYRTTVKDGYNILYKISKAGFYDGFQSANEI